MEKEREEKLNKITETLEDAMRFSSKIYAVDALFLQDDGDICINEDSALGIHVMLIEMGEQIGGSISEAITLVNELK